jgi:hypothetical protein
MVYVVYSAPIQRAVPEAKSIGGVVGAPRD